MNRCRNCKTENPDDAKFCVQCGFTLEWHEKPAETSTQARDLTLEPEHVRVMVGERATVRLAGGPPADLAGARWIVVGDAAKWAHVVQGAGELLVELAPPAGERARSLSLELCAMSADTPAASARGTLELLAPPVVEPVPVSRRPPRRMLVIAAASVAAIAVVAVVLVLVVGGPDAVNGRVNTRFKTLVVHSNPQRGTGNLVRPFLADGQAVTVVCREGAFAKLGERRFVFLSELDLDGEPPSCE